MPITTFTDGEILTLPVGSVIKQFSLGTMLVGITSDGLNNLARCKAILEIIFDKIGFLTWGNLSL